MGIINRFMKWCGYQPIPSPAYIEPLKWKQLYTLRIWKLGSFEHHIYPTEAAVERLSNILESWDGKSDIDIIWGPDLTVEEHRVTIDDVNGLLGNPNIKIIKSEDGKLTLKAEDDNGI